MSQSTVALELLALEASSGPGEGLSPSELHGATVGVGVGDPGTFELQDLVDLLGADTLADAESVSRFVVATLDALSADDLSFAPLLPDDEAPMTERLDALAAWCQSFLAGLAVGLSRRGIDELGGLPEEVQEIVQDMVAIAQLETELTGEDGEDGEDGETDPEADFMELAEYVKVGTLIIRSLSADAGDDPEE
jgi:uncharacterized protein YgfB (UPF0149 family)